MHKLNLLNNEIAKYNGNIIGWSLFMSITSPIIHRVAKHDLRLMHDYWTQLNEISFKAHNCKNANIIESARHNLYHVISMVVECNGL